MCGEVQVILTRGEMVFKLHAVVVKELDCEILAGMPFLNDHEMVLDIPKNKIHVGKHHIIQCESKKEEPKLQELLRCEKDHVIHPGESQVFKISNFASGTEVSIEPHHPHEFSRNSWPQPMYTRVVNGTVSIPNELDHLITLREHQHVAVVRKVKPISSRPLMVNSRVSKASTKPNCRPVVTTGPYSSGVSVDPDAQLTIEQREAFVNIHFEGSVAKIADDLYAGASSINELLTAWERVLEKFQDNNLKLSARKTIICPVSCTILGWQWSQGSVSASPHKVNPLSTATPPATVKGLRSWIGAVKHLKPCIPNYSSLLAPLETAVGGRE